MKVLTRDFGEVDINECDIIKFEQPIFGFENFTDFIMLYDNDFHGEYAWLQSTQEPNLCFIIANPLLTLNNYNPNCKNEAEKIIGLGEYEYWLIMVVKDDFRESTVNLKSPVIINLKNNKAMQIILEDDYPIRYQLFEAGKELK